MFSRGLRGFTAERLEYRETDTLSDPAPDLAKLGLDQPAQWLNSWGDFRPFYRPRQTSRSRLSRFCEPPHIFVIDLLTD